MGYRTQEREGELAGCWERAVQGQQPSPGLGVREGEPGHQVPVPPRQKKSVRKSCEEGSELN